MMNRKNYIFILAAASIALSICTAQSAGNSRNVQRRTLAWGNADLTKTLDGMNVRFTLHQQREIQNLDKGLPIQSSSYSCFVQVPSGKNVSLQVQRQSSHRIAAGNLSSYTLSALSKLAGSELTPIVKVQGYHWFRGKRLARLSISAYTNKVQGLQAIDTVDVALHYTTSPTYRTAALKTGEDKQFKTVFKELLLNSDDVDNASDAIAEPLIWTDSTRSWLPQNGKAIKLTIPNDGVYRLTYSDLTALSSDLSNVDPKTFRLFNKGNELPLNLKTGNTGQLNYLEFVGQRNYNGPAYRYRSSRGTRIY